MKTLLFSFSLLLFFGIQIVRSQVVNIENKRIYDDTSGWSGSLDGGFSAVQNSQLFYSMNFRPRVQYKTRKHYYFLLSDLNYTASQNTVYANSGMSHFRYAYRLKNGPWKWESYVQVQYNVLLDQRIRSLIGSGIRWKMYDKNKQRFFIGSSVFAEQEEIRTTAAINNTIRWSNYLSWFLSGKNGLSFTAATYYQPAFKDFCDIRFAGQYSIGFQVLKRVDLRLEASFFSDTRPPEGVRRTVFNTSLGFRVRLGE